MTEHEASRTLVKSPPELWAECSEATSLARHLHESFGEIRITKLDPETSVAWEGEQVSGTVRLEPSGWGTRVILTARSAAWQPQVVEPPDEPPKPSPVPGPAPSPAPEPPPTPSPPPEPEPLPPAAQAHEPESSASADASEPDPDELKSPSIPPPTAAAPPPTAPRARSRGLFARLWGRLGAPPAREPEPSPVAVVEPPPPPAPTEPPEPPLPPEPPEPVFDPPDPPDPPDPALDVEPGPDPSQILTAALDSLGQAHHRPFSRA